MGYRNKLMTGRGPTRAPTEDELRGTGRSTALALHYLALAIRDPGHPVTVKDHHDTRASDGHLLSRMTGLAMMMGLQFLVFDSTRLTVTYDNVVWQD